MVSFVHVHRKCLYWYILSFNNVMPVCNCNCLHVSIIRVIGFYHSTKFRCSTPYYKNYIVWLFLCAHWKTCVYLDWLLCQWATCPFSYVPIIMCGSRLFIVVVRELHFLKLCLPWFLWCVQWKVWVYLVSSWLVLMWELHNHLWPGAVYCCLTRTTLFTDLLTCWFHHEFRCLSLYQVLLL